MKSRRQALKLCLDAVVVVVIEIFNKFLFEVIHRLELLQIQKFTFKQAEEVFYYSIVQTVTFSAHALLDAFLLEHLLILFVLVLPALVRMENQAGSVWNFCESPVKHGCYHAQNRSVRNRITDQIAAVQIKNG